MIVFVLNRITWRELRGSRLPNISRFLQTASVGLMNTKGPQDKDAASVWVTLGAGRGAAAGIEQMKINAGSAGPPAGVVNFAEIIKANRRGFTQAEPGLLGETLSRHGVKNRTLIRFGHEPDMSPALVADAEGRIPQFLAYPGARAWTSAWTPTLRPYIHSGLTVMSLNLPRDAVSGSYPHIGAVGERRETLSQADADALFGEALEEASSNGLVILLSPSCPQFTNPHSRALAPIAIKGPGFPPGLLVSSSTRRVGLVANVDFAPTVLDFFTIPIPLEMVGRPLRSEPSAARLGELDALDNRSAAAYRLREEFTPLFCGIAGGLLVVVATFIFLAPARAVRSAGILTGVILLLTASPLAIFLLSATSLDRAPDYLLATLLLGSIIAVAAGRSRHFPEAFGLICLATAAAIWADLLAGSPLMRHSLLGYDAIIGSRFYGLGNAEAGLFISALLLAAGMLLDANPRPGGGQLRVAIGLLVGLAMLHLGASFGGANWGQGLAGAAAALAFWVLTSSPIKRRRRLLGAGLLFFLAALVFAGSDLFLPQERQSHLAYSLRLVLAEGPASLLSLAGRKLAMAGRLFAYSPLLPLAIPVFAFVIFLPLRPPGSLRQIVGEHSSFASSLSACGIAAVMASLLNDSGIVAGIAIVCLPMLGLIYMAVEGRHAGSGP